MMKPVLSALAIAACAAQLNAGVLIHGHRGSRGTMPEDTLPAFDAALKAGADALELDMNVTKDDVIVVSHEPNITPALCLGPDGKKLDKPVPIRSLTLEEVKKYDCGSLPNPKFPKQVQVPGTRIPTLDEVFALVETSTWPAAKAAEFNIETKIFPAEPWLSPAPEAFAALVVNTVKKHGMQARVMVQSFDVRTLKAVRKLDPSIRLSQLTSEELVDIVPALKAAGIEIWSPNYKWITPEAVKAAHAAGIKVVPWTVNNAREWDALIDGGVDAIITDYPEALADYLRSKKLR